MSTTSSKNRRACPERKRGGQPANTNALKHGIYSRHYTPEELLALDQDVKGSLKDEMEILRLTIASAADSVLKEPQTDLPFHDHVSALRTIAVAIARLENVIQTRISVFGDPDQREKQVDIMLALMEQAEKAVGLEQQEGSPQNGEVSLAAAFSDRDVVACETISKLTRGGFQSPFQPSKKKSGGQLGNSNAYKHGFYARAFTPSEKKLLQGDGLDQLWNEEALLRVLILPAWRSLRSIPPGSITYQEYLFTLRSIAYAIYVIEKLQRARRRLFGDRTELEKDIQLGLDEARADLGILNFLDPQVKK